MTREKLPRATKAAAIKINSCIAKELKREAAATKRVQRKGRDEFKKHEFRQSLVSLSPTPVLVANMLRSFIVSARGYVIRNILTPTDVGEVTRWVQKFKTLQGWMKIDHDNKDIQSKRCAYSSRSCLTLG